MPCVASVRARCSSGLSLDSKELTWPAAVCVAGSTERVSGVYWATEVPAVAGSMALFTMPDVVLCCVSNGLSATVVAIVKPQTKKARAQDALSRDEL